MECLMSYGILFNVYEFYEMELFELFVHIFILLSILITRKIDLDVNRDVNLWTKMIVTTFLFI